MHVGSRLSVNCHESFTFQMNVKANYEFSGWSHTGDHLNESRRAAGVGQK